MGRPAGNPKDRKYEIENMWEHHHEILRRLTVGQSPGEIAHALGITTQTVSNIRNSEVGVIELAILKHGRDEETVDIGEMIRKEARESFLFLRRIRLGDEEMPATLAQKIHIAERMMDADSDTAKVHRLEGKTVHAHLTLEEIDDIKRCAREAEVTAIAEGAVEAEVVLVE